MVATVYIAIAWTIVLWGYEYRFLPLITNDFPEDFPLPILRLIQIAALSIAAAYFWVTITSPWELRVVYWSVFLLALVIEYGYVFALGRFSLVQDYRMGAAVIDKDLVVNDLKTFVLNRPVFLFPLAGYSILLIWTATETAGGLWRIAAILLALVVFYSLLYPFSRGTFRTLAFNAALRTLIFVFWRWIRMYRGGRQALSIPVTQKPANNIIFVVDESVRWDHLSLNGYSRSTTPYLEKLLAQGKLYNWGLAVAGATMSASANLMLLTGVRQVPDTTQDYRRWPTLFQYARAMGYQTYHIDAQTGRRWLLSKQDLHEVDHWIVNRAFQSAPGYDVDFAAARYVRQQIENATGKLFWINKMGLHFPYLRRLPGDAAAWQPVMADSQYDPARHEEIVNTYDSALAYNLDRFFQELLGPDGLANTIIVYTSDHAQTLSDNGEPWPHTGGTPNEVGVPLFIVSDQHLSVDTAYPASHANLFATLLDLMGVPAEARQNNYATSLLEASSRETVRRYYLYGDMESQANGKAVLFDGAG